MKIMKTMVGNDRDGSLQKADTIEYEGKLWLVPHWLDSPAEGVRRPNRLIRLDSLRHQQVASGSQYGVDYFLNEPIAKALLGLETPREAISGFEVRELPSLAFPLPKRGSSDRH
jgi:hypothetical protein